MTEVEQLREEIDALEAQIKPKRQRLDAIYQAKADAIDQRVKLADSGKGDFTAAELEFAAHARCVCGAGLAYPPGMGIRGAFHCSAILMGQAKPGTTHDEAKPFAFYEIKSEGQPSARGATTRPA